MEEQLKLVEEKASSCLILQNLFVIAARKAEAASEASKVAATRKEHDHQLEELAKQLCAERKEASMGCDAVLVFRFPRREAKSELAAAKRRLAAENDAWLVRNEAETRDVAASQQKISLGTRLQQVSTELEQQTSKASLEKTSLEAVSCPESICQVGFGYASDCTCIWRDARWIPVVVLPWIQKKCGGAPVRSCVAGRIVETSVSGRVGADAAEGQGPGFQPPISASPKLGADLVPKG